MQPQATPATSATPFDRLGGEVRVKALVDRFYDLMDLEPQYTALRAVHGEDLSRAREHLFWFLCGWLGGPSYFTEKVGAPMLRRRHLPFSIGVLERDQWMACMNQAMVETDVPDDLREQLYPAFMKTADWMRNRAD
ncbi:group II truncated hemoglobin [Orrella marina]|uniref:Globin n=1 Tax=Orrella marina TaxID=2163011 RepID=A0A2R4XGA1_9BURK|nr:group II truncated hemoglobin [Orrella marina]AWB32805.1 globin [Orrella marina]